MAISAFTELILSTKIIVSIQTWDQTQKQMNQVILLYFMICHPPWKKLICVDEKKI